MRSHRPARGGPTRQSARVDVVDAAFRDHERALPVVVAVDHHEDDTRVEVNEYGSVKLDVFATDITDILAETPGYIVRTSQDGAEFKILDNEWRWVEYFSNPPPVPSPTLINV